MKTRYYGMSIELDIDGLWIVYVGDTYYVYPTLCAAVREIDSLAAYYRGKII